GPGTEAGRGLRSRTPGGGQGAGAPAGRAAYLGGVPPAGARGPAGGRGGRQGPPASGHGVRGQEQGAKDAPGRDREARIGRVIAAAMAGRRRTPAGHDRPVVTRVEGNEHRPFIPGAPGTRSWLSVLPTRNSRACWPTP